MDSSQGNKRFAASVNEATSALPALVERRNIVLTELGSLNQRIQALELFIAAFSENAQSPQVTHTQTFQFAFAPGLQQGGPVQIFPPPNTQSVAAPPSNVPVAPPVPIVQSVVSAKNRAPRGLVYQVVDALLRSGNKFRLADLREELIRQTGMKFGISSLHRAVAKGLAEGKYESKDGYWFLAGSPKQEGV